MVVVVVVVVSDEVGVVLHMRASGCRGQSEKSSPCTAATSTAEDLAALWHGGRGGGQVHIDMYITQCTNGIYVGWIYIYCRARTVRWEIHCGLSCV